MAKTTKFSVILFLVLPSLIWASLAILYDAPFTQSVKNILAIAFPFCLILILKTVKPFTKALITCGIVFALLVFWWLSIKPQLQRAWSPEYAELPRMEFNGDTLTVHNLRNFDYYSETDATPRWETRVYNLSKLKGFDIFLSYWGSPHIAHTIVSWEFENDKHLAISIETRREEGETYSAIAGFFRQFELYYVVADERDLIKVRTNYRNEDVYLYRLKANPELARAILTDYGKTINQLNKKARWYNALTHNCTTSIRLHVLKIGIKNPWNWRILANGHIDELWYKRGTINTSMPFPQMRNQSYISRKKLDNIQDSEFSSAIRQNLPPRPVSD